MDDGSAVGDMLGDVDARIDASLNRLNSVKSRLLEVLWDTGADELRDCLADLETIIQEHTRFRRDFRGWLHARRDAI